MLKVVRNYWFKNMNKEEFKNYLIIFFVVIELLSMIFNFYFVEITIFNFSYNLNFSIVFFCLGFFIVDIIADLFSPREANRFIFYKLFSQVVFLLFGNLAILVYAIGESEIAQVFNKSAWMLMSGLIATYIGFYFMSSIMSHMKVGVYQGTSVFKRYLYSTIPGELLFSLIFSILCFYKNNSFEELMHIFVTSATVKILLSIIFAALMSVVVRLKVIDDLYRPKLKSRMQVN